MPEREENAKAEELANDLSREPKEGQQTNDCREAKEDDKNCKDIALHTTELLKEKEEENGSAADVTDGIDRSSVGSNDSKTRKDNLLEAEGKLQNEDIMDSIKETHARNQSEEPSENKNANQPNDSLMENEGEIQNEINKNIADAIKEASTTISEEAIDEKNVIMELRNTTENVSAMKVEARGHGNDNALENKETDNNSKENHVDPIITLIDDKAKEEVDKFEKTVEREDDRKDEIKEELNTNLVNSTENAIVSDNTTKAMTSYDNQDDGTTLNETIKPAYLENETQPRTENAKISSKTDTVVITLSTPEEPVEVNRNLWQ